MIFQPRMVGKTTLSFLETPFMNYKIIPKLDDYNFRF